MSLPGTSRLYDHRITRITEYPVFGVFFRGVFHLLAFYVPAIENHISRSSKVIFALTICCFCYQVVRIFQRKQYNPENKSINFLWGLPLLHDIFELYYQHNNEWKIVIARLMLINTDIQLVLAAYDYYYLS